MGFWIKNIIFLVILLGLAVYVFANYEQLTAMVEGEPVTETIQTSDDKNTEVIEPPQRKTKPVSKNAAAEGLSRFYANLHGDDDEDGPRIRDNVVFLPDPKGELEKVLQARAKVTRPLRKNWRGQKASRPFRIGSTLNQKLTEYAAEEGLEVIWWLNKDFIIKDPFRINKELLQTAFQIGQGVAGHFPDGLNTYFCFNQRSIVFIEGNRDFLTQECRLLTSKLPPSDRRRN